MKKRGTCAGKKAHVDNYPNQRAWTSKDGRAQKKETKKPEQGMEANVNSRRKDNVD